MKHPQIRLADLIDFKGGGTPNRKVEEFWNGHIPWATVKDFKSTVISETQESITEEGVKESATNVIPAGTIIIPTRMALGKAAIITVDMAINQDLKALIIKDSKVLERDYLLHFLVSKAAVIEGYGQGATVKGITLDVLRNMEIALPPLKEQKRIAAILDKADSLRRKRQQAIQLADQFLRAVFLDMFGASLSKPRVRLGDVASSVEYGLTASAVEAGDGPQMLRITDIQDDFVDWSTVPRCECHVGDEKKYQLSSGDIVFARTGATTGKSYLLVDPPQRSVFASYLIRVRPSDVLEPVFLSHFFKSSDYWGQVKAMSQGAAQPGINGSKLKDLMIPLPNMGEQIKFRRIAQMVYESKNRFNRGADLANVLFGSVSSEAFSGA